MPHKENIDLAAVRACLDTVCAKCGHHIPPAEVQRIDFDKMKCPACGKTFKPRKIEREQRQ